MSREQLLVVIGEQAKQIAALTALNEELAAKLARVEHLLSRNSGNPSMPPARGDEPGRTPPARLRAPARPQLGHPPDAAVAGRRSGPDAPGGQKAPWWTAAVEG